MADPHDFRDDGQAGHLSCFPQKLQAFRFQALERIGAGAGFEGAASKELGAGVLYTFGDLHDLPLRLHRAGACDQAQAAVTDFLASRQCDHRVIRVEFPVGFFVGLLYPFDAFHNILGGDIIDIDGRGIADKA